MTRRAAFGLAALAGLALSGCARDFDAAAIRDAAASTATFDLRLGDAYLALAEAERAEEDWADAQAFAERAVLAFAGEAPAPEIVEARRLAPDFAAGAALIREEFLTLRAGGSEILAASATADAQAAFDCWLQEAEEGHQAGDIAACKAMLDAALKTLRDNRNAAIFVLLPDERDPAGGSSILVEQAGATATLDEPGAAATVGPAAPPKAVGVLNARQIDALFAEALTAEPAPPVRFVLYFISGTSELTPESKALLPEAQRVAAGRPAPRIDVVGHTDRVGGAETNTRLARERASAVGEQLSAVGVPQNAIRATSFGEADNAVPTADGVAEPKNRRVEILVR